MGKPHALTKTKIFTSQRFTPPRALQTTQRTTYAKSKSLIFSPAMQWTSNMYRQTYTIFTTKTPTYLQNDKGIFSYNKSG